MKHAEAFRLQMIDSLKRELVGPEGSHTDAETLTGGGTEEVLQESPIQRYSAGVLFPQKQPVNEIELEDYSDDRGSESSPDSPEMLADEQAEELSGSEKLADRLTDAYDETVRMANEYLPSAMGMTFLSRTPKRGLIIKASAARYVSEAPLGNGQKLRLWRRFELAIEPILFAFDPAKEYGIQDYSLAENLNIRIIHNARNDGTRFVTVTIYNARVSAGPGQYSGGDCFFQVGFEVTDADGEFVFPEYGSGSFSKHNAVLGPERLEEESLRLLYRNRLSYGVGHGCSVDWGEERKGSTDRLTISVIPNAKVPPIEPRTQGGTELSMYELGGGEGSIQPEDIPPLLRSLYRDYELWIDDRKREVEDLPEHYTAAASENLRNCERCLRRIGKGIDLLEAEPLVLKAFQLMNQAILMQQYHSRLPLRNREDFWEEFPADYRPKKPKEGKWRTFQLAFILMNLPAILGNEHPLSLGRDVVDLIWFPTGGGKTEAYLGLAAFNIFYRRLMRPSNGGCAVLMRYTLRLLTSQQFQRASSLICACEKLRRKDQHNLGQEPISIGLWVGESLTPIRRADALSSLNSLAAKQDARNPFQLLKCPWCGTALDNRVSLGYVAHGRPKTVIFVCPDDRCAFSTRTECLPVKVIDEDIYGAPPTLLIGTVDKFALLAWRSEASRIFGLGADCGSSPPDLIIQDELHLISGPLGSVVGLYEPAIDLLCSWQGARPKIVASTATIRRAFNQCKALYDRETTVFPPQALEISDSFFAQENQSAPGRIYVGVMASAAPSFVTALVRALSSILQSVKSIQLPEGASEAIRDPYWTVLQYFNSLRELGHAATLVEADIPEYMWAIASRNRLPRSLCRTLGSPVEMTSRRTADEIPDILERLQVRYPRASDSTPRPLDTLLATNMISVGVDVDRLGLMVVVGQPKTTSEYIQATSRVGRSASAPGLIVTMYNPGKPRDRSHFEHFRTFHSAFYQAVEPTSVTPFSLPVLDRALHAVLVSLSRHYVGLRSPDGLRLDDPTLRKAVDFLEERCRNIDSAHYRAFHRKVESLLHHWYEVSPSEWGRFGSPPPGRPLMYPAGSEPLEEWDGSPWPTPSSMRSVDVECEARVIPRYPSASGD